MGSDTLVDLVAKIWSLGSATISKVKSVASDVFEGIKAGIQFIKDAILAFILDSMVSISVLLMHALADVLSSAISDVTLTKNSDGISINNDDISIKRQGLSIIIEFLAQEFNLGNLIVGMPVNLETLGPNTIVSALMFDVIMGASATSISIASKTNPAIIPLLKAGNSLALWIYFLTVLYNVRNSQSGTFEERDMYRQNMFFYFMAAAAGSFLSSFQLPKGYQDKTDVLIRNQVLRNTGTFLSFSGLIASGISSFFGNNPDAFASFLLALGLLRLNKIITTGNFVGISALNNMYELDALWFAIFGIILLVLPEFERFV